MAAYPAPLTSPVALGLLDSVDAQQMNLLEQLNASPSVLGTLILVLQAPPTWVDIEALVSRLEDRRDLQLVQTEVQSLSYRLTTGKMSLASLENRVSQLEQVQTSQVSHVSSLQLHLEELEDLICRNNLWFWGIPEVIGQESLEPMVLAIPVPPQDLEFDRMHRTLGPHSADLNRPRDVICCLHHYAHKELTIRKAWEAGKIDLDGASVKILADLSRATLQGRALLCPLLDKIRQLGGTYRWGFPISLTVRKGPSSFSLFHPVDLPDLFTFLGIEAFSIPNWLKPIR